MKLHKWSSDVSHLSDQDTTEQLKLVLKLKKKKGKHEGFYLKMRNLTRLLKSSWTDFPEIDLWHFGIKSFSLTKQMNQWWIFLFFSFLDKDTKLSDSFTHFFLMQTVSECRLRSNTFEFSSHSHRNDSMTHSLLI